MKSLKESQKIPEPVIYYARLGVSGLFGILCLCVT